LNDSFYENNDILNLINKKTTFEINYNNENIFDNNIFKIRKSYLCLFSHSELINSFSYSSSILSPSITPHSTFYKFVFLSSYSSNFSYFTLNVPKSFQFLLFKDLFKNNNNNYYYF
jgi:hypothetical protein